MLTQKQKLTLIFIAAFVSVLLYTVYFQTGDGRWIYPQFPGFIVGFMMCGKKCTGADGAIANATWILFSFIQYYAIFRVFAWLYLRMKKRA
jgi:hypothetical protein